MALFISEHRLWRWKTKLPVKNDVTNDFERSAFVTTGRKLSGKRPAEYFSRLQNLWNSIVIEVIVKSVKTSFRINRK